MKTFKQYITEIKDKPGGRYLHGTLRSNIPSIRKNWLQPKLGDNTLKAYGHDDELNKPLVHLAHEDDLEKAHSAIINHIGIKLNKHPAKVTPKDIQRHGALIVHTPDSEWDKPSLYDPESGHETGHEPQHIEPGDHYSRDDVRPTGILKGKRLVKFLDKRGMLNRFNK